MSHENLQSKQQKGIVLNSNVYVYVCVYIYTHTHTLPNGYAKQQSVIGLQEIELQTRVSETLITLIQDR